MRLPRILLFGFLTWLVPFVISFGFYTPTGELLTSHDLFKSVMVVVLTGCVCYLLYRYFKEQRHSYAKSGWLIGVSWLVINLLLDVVILVPLAKMTYRFYFESIGLLYLVIAIVPIAIGYTLQKLITLKTA
jgi:hypothetical protein